MNIDMQRMELPPETLASAKRLMGFDYGASMYHVLCFDFGDDGGAIGIWREGDNFCARISLDSLAQFADFAKAMQPPAKGDEVRG